MGTESDHPLTYLERVSLAKEKPTPAITMATAGAMARTGWS
jgi:hypothetical protein